MAEFDNYLPCENYSAAPDSDSHPGFKTWHDESTGSWYFAVVTNRGRVVLRSEAYASESARDNGIDSVNRNRDNEDRYNLMESEGIWYIILKAGNHQEIARSCGHRSEAAARADVPMCMSNAVETAAVVEDYLSCDAYSGHEASAKYPGFVTFEQDGQYYFAMQDGAGNVMLRSEGYTSSSSRDNGIESVNKNRDKQERFSVVQDENDGQWYIVLKAGNHQEIARSCPFESAGAAQAIIDRSFAAAMVAATDNYLPCEAYASQAASEKHPGFTTFTHEGQHFFAMVDGHAGVILRSEAYTSASSRDNGIESVLRNRDNEDRYEIVQDPADNQWYVCLKAGNHQEIARSCGFDDHAAAEAHLLHCYSKEALEKIATGAGQIVEDYLPCDAYTHGKDSGFEGFSIFQDKDTKLHYFAMLGDDGKVALKSEGYKDPTRRDSGIESVIRNRGIKDHWREIEDDQGYYMSLRAVNHQEIARSCHYKDHAAMAAWFLPFLGAHTNWGNDAEPEEVVAPPAVSGGAGATMSSYTNAPAAVSGGSDWWKWLLGALLLLGLLWLLMRGCDGCNKKDTGTTAVTTPAAGVTGDTMRTNANAGNLDANGAGSANGANAGGDNTAAPTPPPTTTNTSATCDCSAQTDPVFKPRSGNPQVLTRLGTNPEFGNSHGLSPAEFFAKLQDKAKNNTADRSFLNRMFKAMGYKNGFADAKADQFSAVNVPAGTVGNMGYSKAHKTVYARLDASGQDLLAFRIKAANGCDLHFMKTCGNHFFFCPK